MSAAAGHQAFVRDPRIGCAVYGPVGNHADPEMPERRDDPAAPSRHVRVQGLALQSPRGQRHHALAVLGKGHGEGGRVDTRAGTLLDFVDPVFGLILSFGRLRPTIRREKTSSRQATYTNPSQVRT